MTGTGVRRNASGIAALSREVRKREKKMEIGFRHGTLCDSYEKQANEQGFTLGDKAELFEKLGFAHNMLHIHGLLTDSQADAVCKKLQKQLVKSVKPLEGKSKLADISGNR